MYKNGFKIILDTLTSAIALIILSPVFLLLLLLLMIANRGNPFFFQKRPGKDERIFTIIKFKTMNDRKNDRGELLPDHKRMTAIGKIVRKTSLDEIPQLINVLKGDMSIVGPRPLLVEYLSIYNDYQKQRHTIRPGITGWAQVNGRNSVSWSDKFKLDIFYVQNISFLLDIKIIFKTIVKVFASDGITDGKTATVQYFTRLDNEE